MILRLASRSTHPSSAELLAVNEMKMFAQEAANKKTYVHTLKPYLQKNIVFIFI